MKSNVFLWLAILVVACLTSWLFLELNQKIENLTYAVERIVEVDGKQVQAIDQLTQNMQDIIGILHDHDAFIDSQKEADWYEQ